MPYSNRNDAKILQFSARPSALPPRVAPAASLERSEPLFTIGEKGLTLWTDALNDQHEFDARYTCDLDNSSPELRWKGAPTDTRSFALVLEDLNTPDAFVHWLVYQIPASVDHLPAGIPPQERLPNGIRQGLNTYRKLGYAGPCPPTGHSAHRYRFTLFALDTELSLPSKVSRDGLLAAIEGHVLDQAEIIGFHVRGTLTQVAG